MTALLHYRVVKPQLRGGFLRRRLLSFGLVVAVAVGLAVAVQVGTGWALAARAVALVAYVGGCVMVGLVSRDMFKMPRPLEAENSDTGRTG